jgi:hypothetical protein
MQGFRQHGALFDPDWTGRSRLRNYVAHKTVAAAHVEIDELAALKFAGTENARKLCKGVHMADKQIDDATRRVPPDKAAKDKENDSQTGPSNKADAQKVKKDELIDDRFQATDN